MSRPITHHGGRARAQAIARDLDPRFTGQPVHPRLFGPAWPTSMRRRWSQLTRVAMDRGPRKRPWEGPIPMLDFDGIFRDVNRWTFADPAAPTWTTATADQLIQDMGGRRRTAARWGPR